MNNELEIRDKDVSCSFLVKVVPRSSVTKIIGVEGGVLKVKVQAPPVEGAANEAVVLALAKWLGRPKSAVELMSGDASRNKKFRVVGLTNAKMLEALENLK